MMAEGVVELRLHQSLEEAEDGGETSRPCRMTGVKTSRPKIHVGVDEGHRAQVARQVVRIHVLGVRLRQGIKQTMLAETAR
jgi:hypothetical protein